MTRSLLFRVSLFLMHAAHRARYYVRRMLGEASAIQGVRILLMRGSEVCLVRHWYAPGVWTFPGGGIKRTESVFEAASREVNEECGYTLNSISGVLGTYTGSLGEGDKVAVVISDDYRGSLRLMPNLEIMERRFFDLDELPDTLSPGNKRRIEEFKTGKRGLKGIPW